MHDPITDMFTRIKNAQAVGKSTVSIPYSGVKQDISAVLKNEGFISGFEKKGRGFKKNLVLDLVYKEDLPAVSDFKRKSTPGQRSYMGWREIFPTKGGFGLGIFSTSKGVMSDKQARKEKIGGEFIVEIW